MHSGSKKILQLKRMENALKKNLKKRKDFQNKLKKDNRKNVNTVR